MDDFLSTALAMLLRTLPDLARKIQTTVAVHQLGLIACEFTDHATAQQVDRKHSGEKSSCDAPRGALFSAADSVAADWAGGLEQESASPAVVGAA